MSVEYDPATLEFERRARELLERSAEALPARTRSRLTRARYAALEGAAPRATAVGRGSWRRWLPAGAVSAAMLAVLLFVGHPHVPAVPQGSVAGGEDLELLADRDALALAQDQMGEGQAAPDQDADYDFYSWAVSAAQDEGNGPVGS